MKPILFLLLTLIVYIGHAQTGKIEGYVFDSISGEPMPFVNISLKKTNYHTITNLHGYFILDSASFGRNIIYLIHVGYRNFYQSIEIKKDKEEIHMFYLQKSDLKIFEPKFLEPERIDSIVFKQKYNKDDSLINEKKIVFGDGGRHGYIYKTYKYNYKNQLFESIYNCRFNVDTSGYISISKYTYNNKAQLVGIETTTSNNLYSTKQNLHYDNKNKLIKKEIQYSDNGSLKKMDIIQYVYDKTGGLILEEQISNGMYIYSKKYK